MVRWALVEKGEVESTQTEAKTRADRGAPEGTVIVAGSQTSGKGRLGRSWVSPPGGLYMSLILRPQRLVKPELVALVAASAVVEGVRHATALEPRIRWPNDVMMNEKKLGGVIAEAESLGGDVHLIIVGIGVNCNAPPAKMGNLQGDSTSIATELGKDVRIKEARDSILESFSKMYDRWRAGEDLQGEWAEKVGTVGRPISIKLKTGENTFSCVAEGIDAEGNLLVALEGESVAISAADLEWLRERA